MICIAFKLKQRWTHIMLQKIACLVEKGNILIHHWLISPITWVWCVRRGHSYYPVFACNNYPLVNATFAQGTSANFVTWWCHQMETLSAWLALGESNSPITGEFPSQRPVKRSFDVFFDLRLNKRLSIQSRRRLFETLSSPLWRQCFGLSW